MDTRKLIDIYLAEIAGITAHLGQDSTANERITAKESIKIKMDAIKKIDVEFYKILNPDGRYK